MSQFVYEIFPTPHLNKSSDSAKDPGEKKTSFPIVLVNSNLGIIGYGHVAEPLSHTIVLDIVAVADSSPVQKASSLIGIAASPLSFPIRIVLRYTVSVVGIEGFLALRIGDTGKSRGCGDN